LGESVGFVVKTCGTNVELSRRRVEESSLPSSEKRLLLEYDEFLTASGFGDARRCGVLRALLTWHGWLGIPFKKAKRENIVVAVSKLEQAERRKGGKFATSTKAKLKFILKAFYRWLRRTQEAPPEVAWLRAGFACGKPKLPKDMLTEEDVKKLIGSARSLRDKAIVSTLWESGMRASEFLNLRWENISFRDKETAIAVFTCGKSRSSKQRRNLLRASAPYLNALRLNNPSPSPGSPLWLASNDGKPLSHRGLNHVLKENAKRAGITKPMNPHNFRHSRTTFLTTRISPAALCEYLGWSQASRMPATYSHLCGESVDDEIEAVYGTKPTPKEKESILVPRKCERCGEVNPANLEFCSKCGFALTLEAALKWQNDEEARLSGMLEELVVRKLREFKAKQRAQPSRRQSQE
jgi:site-specific recombinase XerD/ribosomal protein L37E